MEACIITFDDFTDIDVFFLWDLLNRVNEPGWRVRILGESDSHLSSTGIRIPMHGHISESTSCDVVLFSSGMGTRRKRLDPEFLSHFRLNPERQLIGSMCSGALLLAALGLLEGKQATTYPTSRALLESTGVRVVERPFVREEVLRSIMPVGEGLSFADADMVARAYVPAEPPVGDNESVFAQKS
jgi:transcriptional regulator GlxA family with amidase domain